MESLSIIKRYILPQTKDPANTEASSSLSAKTKFSTYFFTLSQKINSFRFVIYLKSRKKIIFTRAACDNTVIFKKKGQAED